MISVSRQLTNINYLLHSSDSIQVYNHCHLWLSRLPLMLWPFLLSFMTVYSFETVLIVIVYNVLYLLHCVCVCAQWFQFGPSRTAAADADACPSKGPSSCRRSPTFSSWCCAATATGLVWSDGRYCSRCRSRLCGGQLHSSQVFIAINRADFWCFLIQCCQSTLFVIVWSLIKTCDQTDVASHLVAPYLLVSFVLLCAWNQPNGFLW